MARLSITPGVDPIVNATHFLIQEAFDLTCYRPHFEQKAKNTPFAYIDVRHSVRTVVTTGFRPLSITHDLGTDV